MNFRLIAFRLRALCVVWACGAACLALASEPAPVIVPGRSTFGTRDFIEYVQGDLPLILVAPHGGHMTPNDIPDRTIGVRESDANTQELARSIAHVVHERTGHFLHLIICHLHRSKLDANREVIEAAQGNSLAEQAWKEHHAFIGAATVSAVRQHGAAFLIDLHGQGHPDPRVELGYLHGAPELALEDERINRPEFMKTGSLELIATRSNLTYAELLRGQMSLGALLEQNGFPSAPSPRMPMPNEPFFRGGYTVQRHCRAEQGVAGVQIEANRTRLRDTEANRLRFAHALVRSLETYLPQHLGLSLSGKRSERNAPEVPSR